ncbi:hypothetical protein [Streptantibioticus cattleyicolor]|uniref:Uncharacterized protein n=1 Tax=Streptantibioticus cattleyicolor (strain ATCC 35852 / DSM 46488 / JCM 4925 / NBRC 14057 / NRRL 8057) TaxID=1003195 RepID=F8JUI5_STREN|nr:hypothetical protein [Streptantibioticus cattleyicolor]AEW95605.1 hypothetical protein SCATT_32340 [Streptantibioticus cattleyicolor NRRL 8057 = DSM 46488]MYS60155.1 hypothetical protein [Streptomyces sp. SID5468]CCB75944.1 protein of unknown function [Streptantibioticus cattleyicolor NRRL 8057 = DSM 46488]
MKALSEVTAYRRVLDPEPEGACWYCRGSKWLRMHLHGGQVLESNCLECNGTGLQGGIQVGADGAPYPPLILSPDLRLRP